MLKLPSLKLLSYMCVLVIILFASCFKKDKSLSNINVHPLNQKSINIESKINFNSVAFLNETNKKIIDIASIAFNNSKKLNESQIILKIKKDHQKIQNDLKKITDENLIIIPEPIYDLNLNQNFLQGINSSYYLISLLEKEIKNQIQLFDTIEKTSKDIEFKNFADKSKDILISNNELLDDLL